MQQKIKRIVVEIFIVLVAFNATAQKDSLSFKDGQFCLNASVGFSSIRLININVFRKNVYGNNLGILGQNAVHYLHSFYYISPAYNLTVDYRISDKISIGMSVSYQYLKDIPLSIVAIETINYTVNPLNYQGSNELVSRLNFAWRYIHSIDNTANKRLQAYWGLGFGVSFWKDELPNTKQYNALIAQYEIKSYSQLNSAAFINPSIQFLAGLKYFVTPHIAFHLETAIAGPYVLQAGATFLLDRKKSSKK